jgi:hypothetical protein
MPIFGDYSIPFYNNPFWLGGFISGVSIGILIGAAIRK